MGRTIYQTSEHRMIAWVLAMVGGYLDAYSYLCRGGVFANAQTGNIVLMGINFAEGNWNKGFYYVCPIVAFSVGIFLCEAIRAKCAENKRFHWRQFILIVEIIVLIAAGFIKGGYINAIVTVMISFVCALQVNAFRRVEGNPYASTMCTGNLRSASEKMNMYMKTKEEVYLKSALQYYGIIGFFILGAALGAVMVRWIVVDFVLLLPAIIGLAVALVLMKKEYL